MNYIRFTLIITLIALPITAAEASKKHKKQFSIKNQSAGNVFVFRKRTWKLIRPSEVHLVGARKLKIDYKDDTTVQRITLNDKQRKALKHGSMLLISGKDALEITNP